jgi:hypothetical protein
MAVRMVDFQMTFSQLSKLHVWLQKQGEICGSEQGPSFKDELKRAVRYVNILAGSLSGFVVGIVLIFQDDNWKLSPFFWAISPFLLIWLLNAILSSIFNLSTISSSIRIYLYSFVVVGTITYLLFYSQYWFI